jgi:hypothetical protein
MPEARTLGLSLGALYIGMGTVELITHRSDTGDELLFWGGSLVGGGALVLAGALLADARRPLGLTLLTVGAALGMNATLWTILIPVFAVLVLVRSYRNEDEGLRVSESPVEGPASV